MSDTPSTEWRETIAPDEAERFESYAKQFAEFQAQRSLKFGKGRALHRKQVAAAKGSLVVLDGLPEFARQGLFAKPGAHETWLRLSNGGMDVASDRKPDIRGLALRVFGVEGESALGGPAKSQDFLLINHEAFSYPKSAEFVEFVLAASRGQGSLLRFLAKRYGVFGMFSKLGAIAKSFNKPFGGFAAETLFSAAPIKCGPYAARVRLVPSARNGARASGPVEDYCAEFATRLTARALEWALQLQPFVSEATTPIEDASVNWPTPYTTVATLTVEQQDLRSDSAKAFEREAEASVFDPWQALAAHRPLGDVMRARKVVYFASQKGRGAQ